jgi:O-antigen/teichoic acid export membrane protein
VKLVASSLLKIRVFLERSPLRNRLAKGAFWSLASAAVIRGFGLIAGIFVARVIGESGFGEWAIIQNTVSTIGTFAGLSLGFTATKFIAEYRISDPLRAGRIRALSSAVAWVSGGIAAMFLGAAAPWLASRTLAAPELGGLLQVSTVHLLFTILNGAQIGALAGFEAFKSMARTSALSGLASFVLVVGGALGWGVQGIVVGQGVGSGIGWLLNRSAIRRECLHAGVPYTSEGLWTQRGVIWRFSIPAVACGGIAAAGDWVLNILLVNQPGGYAQLGLFNVAKQWQNVILYIPLAIASAMFPLLSQLRSSSNAMHYRKALITGTLGITGIALLMAIPVAVWAGPIMKAYGPGFSGGHYALQIMCGHSVLFTLSMLIGQAMWAAGESVEALVLTVLRTVILLGTFWILREDGAVGLATALLATFAAQTLYMTPYVWYKLWKVSL